MADVSYNVITPAASYALMTLDEAKIALGIPVSDVSSDPQLQWLIDTNSDVIATMCNRVFAKEKVVEMWRDLDFRRVYLTHWPVKATDIESVTTNAAVRLDYELEERSGKLSIFTDRNEPIVITYTGGFNLPDEAPKALKQATGMLVGLGKSEQQAAQLTGVRMISHKESRVMFHSNTGSGGGSGGDAATRTRDAVNQLLYHYMKFWI
jgi:hypothetical protein